MQARVLVALGSLIVLTGACGSSTPSPSARSSAPAQSATPRASDPIFGTPAPTVAPSGGATPAPNAAGTPGPSLVEPDAMIPELMAAAERLDELTSYRAKINVSQLAAEGMTEIGTSNEVTEMTYIAGDPPALRLEIELATEDETGSAFEFISKFGHAWGSYGEGYEPFRDGSFAPIEPVLPAQRWRDWFIDGVATLREVGQVERNGRTVRHLRGEPEAVREFYAVRYGLDGPWALDVWLDAEAGFLVAAELHGTGAGGRDTGYVDVTIDISHIDDPTNEVVSPEG